jgi:general secretion pathway protein L
MAARAGLFLHDQQLSLVALTRRGAVEHIGFELGDHPSALLKAELGARRLRLRGLRIGLQRSLVTVKALELPPAVGGDMAQMVSFELERHVPFPPEDIAFDFAPLPAPREGPSRVLVAACERRTVERALRLLEAPKLRPLAITVACHDLPALLRRGLRTGRAVWAHHNGAMTDLVFLQDGALRLSRTVPVESAEVLADEVGGTLPLLGWSECDVLWVSGDDAADLLASDGLRRLGLAVSEPPYAPAAAALVAALPEDQRGPALLALAAAAGSRRPVLNLLSEALRPQTFSGAQIATAALAVVAAGLGLGLLLAQGHRDQRYLDELTAAGRALEPDVKAVEGIAAELNQNRRLLANLESIRRGGIRPLPLLRELTELVPQDTWLNTLSMDVRGVELAGQANAANQLIPLLESSASLERVEFTSPVTKGRDKEQFRIKAAWEPGAARQPIRPSAGAGPPPGTRPGSISRPGAPAPPGAARPAPPPSRPGGPRSSEEDEE